MEALRDDRSGARHASRADRLRGVLLGTAVGDALGLPREMMSPRRAARIFGAAPLRHRFVFGRGMVSDDTEHACMTARALLRSGGDPARFARSLAWGLRWWLLGLPAGVGLATAKAVLRLWVGFPPRRSGVRSAGCGPAMRSVIIGAYAGDVEKLKALVNASSLLTHNHPTAADGALAIALAGHYACATSPDVMDAGKVLTLIRAHVSDTAILDMLRAVETCLREGADARRFVATAGLERGVSGYVVHVVGACLFCWLRWPGDFRTAVTEVVLLGGDTDSSAAALGGLVGAGGGEGAVPPDWLAGLIEWPRSVGWMRKLADALADGSPSPRSFWPAVVPRNLFFLAVVLAHGLRRLLPPY